MCIYMHVSYIIQVEAYPTCCLLFFVGTFFLFYKHPGGGSQLDSHQHDYYPWRTLCLQCMK